MDYDLIREMLSTMNERSRLYAIVKEEVEKRGHWKAKDRGISGFDLERKRRLRGLSTNGNDTYQVNRDESAFSDDV